MFDKELFENPVQVKFWDFEDGRWCAGIAWKEHIICACCGATFEIKEVYEYAPVSIENPIIIYETWVNLFEEITGDDFDAE